MIQQLRQYIPVLWDSVHRSYRFSAVFRLSCCFFIFLLFRQPGLPASPAAGKIISVRVNASGTIIIGKDTVSSDAVALYIRERLFKSYTGTGKMYDAIKLSADGNPEQTVLDVVKKEIANGQKKALNELCIEKYRKQFEDISKRQQDKLKKNFPVLFQTSYD